jgi:hypothetical protein
VQTVGGGQEFYLDLRYGGVSNPELPHPDGVDLSAYTLEITLRGPQKDAQLFFKDRGFNNLYSERKPITSDDHPMRFDPVHDPCEVCQFRDLTHIYAVGAKIWGGVQGVDIISARLVERRTP